MNELQKRDLAHVWHPCSQMKDYEAFPPIPVEKAMGPFIITQDGRKIIDAISSWWCKSLGHSHQRIRRAVERQIKKFEHLISANTCNETLVELSERLAELAAPLNKVFYADNGSTAVEIALKMSLQFHAQTGNPGKKKFMSLENGYHGETVLALAAGDCELYSKPFSHLLPKIGKIRGLPYISGDDSPMWSEISDGIWRKTERQLEGNKPEDLAAIIFEPVVQGAGGMKIYSPDLLRKLRKWTSKNNVHMIADEIMTGFGRTGKVFACAHAGITPDFMCLSKGLTAGWAPMSAVLTRDEIFRAFYGDYSSGRAFLHSNTYAGYALGAAAALEALKIYEDDRTFASVARRSRELRRRMEWVASETGALRNVRGIGFIAAGDIVDPASGRPFPPERRTGFRFYRKAVEFGALLRPLGDTIYFLPPLNTPEKVLDDLAGTAVEALNEAMDKK